MNIKSVQPHEPLSHNMQKDTTRRIRRAASGQMTNYRISEESARHTLASTSIRVFRKTA